jgi:DNA-binding NarL/FixJ family response regulator
VTAVSIESTGPIRIAILSEDRLYREGLRQLVSGEPTLSLVGYGGRASFPAPPQVPRPDVLLLDGRTEEVLTLCASLEEGRPRILLLAAAADEGWSVRALKAGVRGILDLDGGTEDLVRAIHVVHSGDIWARRRVMLAGMGQRVTAATVRGDSDVPFERLLSLPGAGGLPAGRHGAQQQGLHGRAELAAAYHGIGGLRPKA